MSGIFLSIVVGLAPLLRGVWDVWAQSAVQIFIFAGMCAWLCLKIFKGELPCGYIGETCLLLAAVLSSAASAMLSPVNFISAQEFGNFAAALIIAFVSMHASEKDGLLADKALRFSAWIVFLLAFYQKFFEKSGFVASSLVTPNSLAAFSIMLFPLAVLWRDWLLAAGMSAIILWTGSQAALLSLAAAGVFAFRDVRIKKLLGVLAFVLAAAVVVESMKGSSLIHDRLVWWEAARRMIADKPLAGFGPGAFAYVFPAYHEPAAGGVSTLYVHNYFLQFAAENGILCSFLWLGWIAWSLSRIRGYVRWATSAVLIHSIFDFGLSIPANLLVLCYLLGRRDVQAGEETFRIQSRQKRVLAVCITAVFFIYSCAGAYKRWDIHKSVVSAGMAYSAGDPASAEKLLDAAVGLGGRDGNIYVLRGNIRLDEAVRTGKKADFFPAAAAFEQALLLNPFRPATYAALERIYHDAGEKSLEENIRIRRARIFKW